EGGVAGSLPAWIREFMPIFLDVNGPEHQRLRRALLGCFKPARANLDREIVRRTVHEILDGIDRGGRGNLVVELLREIPARLYCHWVDIPISEVGFVARVNREVIELFDGRLAPDQAIQLYDATVSYMKDLIANRSRNLGGDVLSELIAAQRAGDLTEG